MSKRYFTPYPARISYGLLASRRAVSFTLSSHRAAANIVAFKLDASFPLAQSLSPAATVISRINIVENGKKSAGCGSAEEEAGPRSREDPSRHQQSIPHVRTSPWSNPRRGESRERSAGRFDEGLLVSGPVLYTTRTSYPSRSSVPSSNSGARELVLENISA